MHPHVALTALIGRLLARCGLHSIGLLLNPELGVLGVGSEAMDLLPVQAETRPLFELAVAAINLADVRVELRVDVEMLCQILLLSKAPATDLTLEPLAPQVNRQEVALEAEP